MERGGYRRGIFIVTYSRKNKAEYLIFKRKLHWKGWEFPKGGLEKGEKILEGLKREIKEETGLKPLKIKKFNVSGNYKYKKQLSDRGGILGQTYALYAVEIKKSKIKIDRLEHSDYKWLSFDKAIKKLTWPNQRRCLRIVNKWLKEKS